MDQVGARARCVSPGEMEGASMGEMVRGLCQIMVCALRSKSDLALNPRP